MRLQQTSLVLANSLLRAENVFKRTPLLPIMSMLGGVMVCRVHGFWVQVPRSESLSFRLRGSFKVAAPLAAIMASEFTLCLINPKP